MAALAEPRCFDEVGRVGSVREGWVEMRWDALMLSLSVSTNGVALMMS